MDYRIIKSPSKTTFDILKRRIGSSVISEMDRVGAVGLVQGKMIEMFCALDIAEKEADVAVGDVKGNCPQHMIMIAIFGDVAAVEAAMQNIKCQMEEGKSSC